MSPINHEVRLIAVTQPLIPGIENAEQLLAYIARVSNPDNQDNNATATKLLTYMIRKKHWSPFEQVDLTIEIQCTRTIGRQILRHGKGFSFQEFSQRYAEVVDDMFVKQPLEARLQDKKNRQSSLETTDQAIIEEWNKIQEDHISASVERYSRALEMGVAKEQARSVLPEGLTMSKMYMKGSLRSWIHYIAVRTDPGTQKEHRLIADDCKKIVCQNFPSLAPIIPLLQFDYTNQEIIVKS